jgi:hypothetical protein
MSREWPAKSRASRCGRRDECAAARPYQQRQSDCDGDGDCDCDGDDAVTDGRQQVAAVQSSGSPRAEWVDWDGWPGALRRGRIVPPTSTSTDPAPASPGIGERGPTPVYPSTSPSSWLALCLSISPASFVPPFPPLSCRLLLLLSIPICCACPGRKLAISTPSSFGTNRVTRGCHTSLLDVVNCPARPHPNCTRCALCCTCTRCANPAACWPASHLDASTPPTPAAASTASQGAQPYLRRDSALASHRPFNCHTLEYHGCCLSCCTPQPLHFDSFRKPAADPGWLRS